MKDLKEARLTSIVTLQADLHSILLALGESQYNFTVDPASQDLSILAIEELTDLLETKRFEQVSSLSILSKNVPNQFWALSPN